MKLAVAASLLALTALSGCDNKPKHYFVICEGQDGNGWELVDSVKQDGYLISCTYQSQDLQQFYTTRCDNDGCGIK